MTNVICTGVRPLHCEAALAGVSHHIIAGGVEVNWEDVNTVIKGYIMGGTVNTIYYYI